MSGETGRSGEAGRSGVWKIVAGCAIGCGVLLLLAFSACVGFVVWVRQPGELIEPARLTGPETIGTVTWTLRIEDPGTEAFVHSLLEKLQEGRAEREKELPSLLRSLGDLQQERNVRQLRESFPILAGIVVEPGGELEGGLPRTLGYLSLKSGGNRLVLTDWLMTAASRWLRNPSMLAYGDETILPIGGSHDDPESAGGFFLRRNDLFVASRLSVARTAVDRLGRGEAAARPASPLDELLAQVPEQSTIRGALLNDHGELSRLIAAIPSAGRRPPRPASAQTDTWDARPGAGRNSVPSEDTELEKTPSLAEPPGLLDLLDQARRVTLEGGFGTDASLLLDLRFTCVEPECRKLLDALVRREGAEDDAEPDAESLPPGSTAGEPQAAGESAIHVTRDGTRGRVTLRIEDPGLALGGLFTIEPGASEEH